MRCYICDSHNNLSLEKIHSESEILICKDCGNLMHKYDEAEEKKNLNFYRNNYRGAPVPGNLVSTTLKQNYISQFLSGFLKDKKGLKIVDIGCATGYLPAYFRSLGHKATGVELTKTYRRFSEAFYGVPVTEELVTKHKYDLIVCYHTLEHMMAPDKKLKHFADCLADDGRIMIATPRWLHIIEEQDGTGLKTFDNLFHKNHINLFTRESICNLFAKCGLEVEIEDQVIYGQTFLLKKKKEPGIYAPTKTGPEEIKKQVLACKTAIEYFNNKDWDKAVEIWPNFPEAHLGLQFQKQGKDPDKQADYWIESFKNPELKSNIRYRAAFAAWLYQQERHAEALGEFQTLLSIKPRPDFLMHAGYCLVLLGRGKEAIPLFLKAAEMSPNTWNECYQWVCKICSDIPCWEEQAEMAIKEKIFEQNKEHIQMGPKDPVMA